MRHVGIDLEQFIVDPYGTGIQRVLQQLALEWPTDDVSADFVVPIDGQFGLLSPRQAAELLTVPFLPRAPGDDLRMRVEHISALLTEVDGQDSGRAERNGCIDGCPASTR